MDKVGKLLTIALITCQGFVIIDALAFSKRDFNESGMVGIAGVRIAVNTYGSSPDHQRWNAATNINGNMQIRVDNMIDVALHYGS